MEYTMCAHIVSVEVIGDDSDDEVWGIFQFLSSFWQELYVLFVLYYVILAPVIWEALSPKACNCSIHCILKVTPNYSSDTMWYFALIAFLIN